MISISLTLSSGTHTFMIPSVIDDAISLHYSECAYCAVPIRAEKICAHPEPRRFCSPRDRSLYHFHHIVESPTL